MSILINGVAQSELPVTDRGLHYGDGLFETLAVVEGEIRHPDLHMKRLSLGCQRLGLQYDATSLHDELKQLATGQNRAVLKAIITRGSGGRGYRPPATPDCRRIVARYPWPDYPPEWQQQGICLRVCQTRLGSSPALAGIKHLNRLEQVMARAEWRPEDDIAEGLMLDVADHVISGTMSNVFYSHAGELFTPALDTAGVAGITRSRICESLAPALGLSCSLVKSVTLDTLQQADEMFACNTLAGIWPVRKLLLENGKSMHYKIGPLNRQLLEIL